MVLDNKANVTWAKHDLSLIIVALETYAVLFADTSDVGFYGVVIRY